MKNRKVNYFSCEKSGLEIIYCENSKISYPTHNHRSVYTVGLVLDGSIVIEKGNNKIRYSSMQVYIVNPYEVHSILSNDGTYSMVSICINKYDILECKLNLRDALQCLVSDGMCTNKQINYFYDIVTVFINEYKKSKDESENLQNVSIKILEEQPECEMNIDDLSDMECISKYHYIRQFKKIVGLTPHQFQMQNRIRNAQKLLSQNHSILEVALTMGFYDQSHFNKCFKKFVGITPLEFIDSFRKIP